MECRSFRGSEDSISRSHHGCGQFFIASKIDMHRECFCPACGMAHFARDQFTGTCEVSEGRKSELTWTLSTAGSRDRARTSALRDLEEAWRASEVDFSSKCVDWSKKSRPDSSSWKTCQPLELVVFEKSSVNLQIWGMTVAGRVFLPRKLEPRIAENDGFYWPTPTARDWKSGSSNLHGKNSRPLNEVVKMWPTPRASDADKGIRSPEGAAAEIARKKLNGVDLPTAIGGGQLNPMWVEWLMGYPSGWTALEPWATQWFRIKPEKRSCA